MEPDRGAGAPPQQAYELLGQRAELLTAYADLLTTAGIDHGLLGPREGPRLWERHLLNCAAPADHVPSGSLVVDVGSGAGLPGLVWALLRPDLRVVLVEPLLRRSSFLREAVRSLGLEQQVRVRQLRAEQLAGNVHADLVTARAVAPLDRLVPWCLPLLRPGGALWALRGRSATEEVERSRPSLRRAGAADVGVCAYGVGVLEPPTTVVTVSRGDQTPRGGQ